MMPSMNDVPPAQPPEPPAADENTSLYRQVMARLRAAIDQGTFPAGSRLPNEDTLCRSFGVSRITLRRAVAELQAEGRLRRVQGSGTYVHQPVYSLALTQPLAPEKLLARQGEVRYTAVRVASLQATEEQAELFGLQDAQRELVEVRRLLCVDGQAIGQQRLVIPRAWCPADYQQAAAMGESLPRLTGFAANSVRQSLSACTLNPRQAEILAAKPGGPAFVADCTAFGREGALYQVVWLFDATRCRFEASYTADNL